MGSAKWISPRELAQSAAELNKGLEETLRYLSEIMSGGQGQSPFAGTARALKEAA